MVIVDQSSCVSCGMCVVSCPIGAVDLVDNGTDTFVAKIDSAVCGICGVCIDRCPAKAISIQINKKNNETNVETEMTQMTEAG
ncbi:MAG: 4Fe-4S binding protein [Planctomycetaceae bacterium]|jgi:formate hydrogenlyase subunit 6/NADH:ubiquinone oxidoreductase subunit I|nr:4Fe-4S binding protein [Planctomycetaceae bacterium]